MWFKILKSICWNHKEKPRQQVVELKIIPEFTILVFILVLLT